MQHNNYLLVGNTTNFVPLLSIAEKYETEIQKLPQDSVSEEVKDAGYDSQISDNENDYEGEPSESIFTDDDNESEDEYANEIQTEDSEDLSEEEFDDIDEEPYIDEESVNEEVLTEDTSSEEPEPESTLGSELELTNNNAMTTVHSDLSETDETAPTQDFIQEYRTEVTQENVETLSDIDIPEDLTGDFDEIENNLISESDSTEDAEQIQQSEAIELESAEPLPVIPIEEQGSDIGDFEELEIDESDDEDIMVDISEDNEQEFVENNENFINEDSDSLEEIDKSIVEDVDKVFSTIKDDGISESDLDLIDTLNGPELSDEELSEDEFFSQDDAEALQGFDSEEEDNDGFLEPLEEISDTVVENKEEKEVLETRAASTSAVPIYEASIPDEDKVVSDPIEQGDTVVHAKYGSGVVEKMIKYGNKNLYSINFDNVGRRLLDPTLTEIKKA